MHIFTDEDVYFNTVKFLRKKNFNIKTIYEVGLTGITDRELIKEANKRKSVLLTRDKGFGELVYFNKMETHGVILLRITPKTIVMVHKQLLNLLRNLPPDRLQNSVSIIEPAGYRIRKLP
jgi:predicted nuclease of predicted toxin-antitoxin system